MSTILMIDSKKAALYKKAAFLFSNTIQLGFSKTPFDHFFPGWFLTIH